MLSRDFYVMKLCSSSCLFRFRPDTAARKRVHTAATDTGTYIKTGYDSTGAIRAVSLSALTPAQTLINSPKLPLPAAAASAAKKKAKLAAQPSLENYFGKK